MGRARALVAGMALANYLMAAPALAVEIPWTGSDLGCITCHAKEAPQSTDQGEKDAEAQETDNAKVGDSSKVAGNAKEANDNSAKVDSAQEGAASPSPHTGLPCIACHSDSELEVLHKNATTNAKMPKKLKKTNVTAEICTTCHDSADLSELTTDCTLLTDDKGTVVNPHELPDAPDHARITCTDCHAMHKDTPVEQTAPAKCLSCHHENVYECGTCH